VKFSVNNFKEKKKWKREKNIAGKGFSEP